MIKQAYRLPSGNVIEVTQVFPAGTEILRHGVDTHDLVSAVYRRGPPNMKTLICRADWLTKYGIEV